MYLKNLRSQAGNNKFRSRSFYLSRLVRSTPLYGCLNSELYFFRKFQNDLKQKNVNKVKNSLYRWLDQIEIEEPTIQYFVENFGTEQLIQQYRELDEGKNKDTKLSFVFNENVWNESRKKFLKTQRNTKKTFDVFWINP